MNKDYWLNYTENIDPDYSKRAIILDIYDSVTKEINELEDILKEEQLSLVQANSVIANLNDKYNILKKQYDTLDEYYSEIQIRNSKIVLRNVILKGNELDLIQKVQELETELKNLTMNKEE